MKIACPNCNKKYDVGQQLAGRKVKCAGCKREFRVPSERKPQERQRPPKPPPIDESQRNTAQRKLIQDYESTIVGLRKQIAVHEQQMRQLRQQVSRQSEYIERIKDSKAENYPAITPTATSHVRTEYVRVRESSPSVAAVLSFLIPGLGQIYNGQVVNGFAWMIFIPLGYVCFIIPGLILHLCCVIGAASDR